MLDKNAYAYKIKLYKNKISLEYIIKVHIEYMFFPYSLGMLLGRHGALDCATHEVQCIYPSLLILVLRERIFPSHWPLHAE
jgi:hypothetical protein